MKKKILLILILLFSLTPKISALKYGNCDVSVISRYKEFVKNVNVSYTYEIRDNVAYFEVTLTNIIPDMLFIDSKTLNTYTYRDTINGEISIKNYVGNDTEYGLYKFYIDNEECGNILLGTKYYKFPIYNAYYNNSLCNGISSYKLCQRWINENITYEKFEYMVNEYRKSLNKDQDIKKEDYKKGFLDIILELYVKYYYYLLGAIIIISLIVIYVRKKKDKFNL